MPNNSNPPIKPINSKLTFIEIIPRPSHIRPQKRWCICRCDCGNIVKLTVTHFMNGHTRSCGCMTAKWHYKKHGLSHSKRWNAYKNMIRRCYDPKDIEFNVYGGRGITVCKEWRESNQSFFDYIGEAPESGRKWSIGRIDNDKPYEPGNVRWETQTQQMRNTQRNHRYMAYGKNLTAKEWAEKIGIKEKAIVSRITHGWSIEDAVTQSVGNRQRSTSGRFLRHIPK